MEGVEAAAVEKEAAVGAGHWPPSCAPISFAISAMFGVFP